MADEQKSVWISCRANAGCEGKWAIVVFKRPNPAGGTSIRYRCTTCNGAFHVTF